MSQYLTFMVAGEEFGVAITQAKEIIECDVMTTVPSAPPFIRGVINLRGSVVPVADLAVKFGRAPSALTNRSCIVVVEASDDSGSHVMGILADRVRQVADMPDEAIEPPPSFGIGMRPDWLVGLARADKRFVLLLHVDRVLTGADLMNLDSVAAGVTAQASAA